MFKLDEALEAIKGHDEFVVKAYDEIVCLDYILCFPGTFDASEAEIAEHGEEKAKRFAWIRRNCRGMTFDQKTGNLVSLPLHKFFNIDQTAETKFERLSSRTATIYEKLDGSMIHFFIHPNGQLKAATCRSTETSQAKEALEFAKQNPLVYERILAIIADGYTPVCEFVAAHNQIVVQYPRPRLVYLISRHRATGHYLFHTGFPDTAKTFDFPFKDIHSYLDREEFEGYVCHLHGLADDGTTEMVKAKTPWYMERHRAVDCWLKPAYRLYEYVYDGIMDDLIGLAPIWAKPKLTAIYEEAQRDLLNEKLRLEKLFEELFAAVSVTFEQQDVGLPARKQHKALRKEFALAARNSPSDFGVLMSLYNGDDPTKALQSRLLDGYKVKYPNRIFADLTEGE